MQNILFYIKKYIRDVIIFTLIGICLAIILYTNYFKEDEIKETISFVDDKNINDINTEEKAKAINIDIKGAVKNPGVYQIEEGKIINDAISLAGGFNSNAYKNGINLSKKLSDEMVIYVYTKSEIEKEQNEVHKTEVIINETSCKVPDYAICECVEQNESVIEVDSLIKDKNTNNATNLVNINTALVNELTMLSGIGESKAQAIIKHREEKGKFNNIAEIMNVSGIGESLYAKIKDYITV